MPSFLNMLRIRKASDEDEASVNSKHSQNLNTECENARTRSWSVRSTLRSAACRGLYAMSPCSSTSLQGSATRPAHFWGPGNTNTMPSESETDSSDDPIITCSMYPQMVGKRRSELYDGTPTRPAKWDRVSSRSHRSETFTRARSPTVSQLQSSWAGSGSTASMAGLAFTGDPEGQPVPHLKCPRTGSTMESFQVPVNPSRIENVFFGYSSSESSATYTPSSRASKRSSLPSDEYQFLSRQQKMQHAREVLEPHFTHRGFIRGRHIYHGLMRGFTVHSTERRRISEVRYAVRKAIQADLELLDDDFTIAMYRHADNVHYSELTDVDGLPISETMLYEFIRLYQRAQDDRCVQQMPGHRHNVSVQRTWIDDQTQRTESLHQNQIELEAVVVKKHPHLVSKFSWDSDDDEPDVRRRLKKLNQ